MICRAGQKWYHFIMVEPVSDTQTPLRTDVLKHVFKEVQPSDGKGASGIKYPVVPPDLKRKGKTKTTMDAKAPSQVAEAPADPQWQPDVFRFAIVQGSRSTHEIVFEENEEETFDTSARKFLKACQTHPDANIRKMVQLLCEGATQFGDGASLFGKSLNRLNEASSYEDFRKSLLANFEEKEKKDKERKTYGRVTMAKLVSVDVLRVWREVFGAALE